MFVTKYQRGELTDAILTDSKNINPKVYTDSRCELREFNEEDDHLHLIVSFPATAQLSRPVNSPKGVSSPHLRRATIRST